MDKDRIVIESESIEATFDLAELVMSNKDLSVGDLREKNES